MCTKLDIKRIAEILNKNETSKILKDGENPLICSVNVGNYLCGYIYLKSLDRNDKKCLFIHVPPIDKPFTSKQTSEFIYAIIKECLNQLEKNV